MTENKPKILIVDDEQPILEALTIRLEANGYEVITAIDGADGLSKARLEKPDLIVLDVMLPKMNGYKVSRMLKFDENYQHIPIIMLTAKIQSVDMEQGKEAGADVYLTKPFQADELLKHIKDLLAKKA
ncbi:hypothetical protein A2311_01175 [candidate division WOR-1 bacterium RIFOXYB2_FULL_48_7]|uniref:Response regulatory domain-containing protein n=1 Tax=candidate division WOR-1 bacterium RIFOXYB2_FULL_48_7 TaxID=1802583 RepID=A0A1F4TNK9_UNCSA|nr:MAG: hypothetical protein A2311_01175 [candidate division WOR-1 bacterium RIFOXYB2_FULL_48_7]